MGYQQDEDVFGRLEAVQSFSWLQAWVDRTKARLASAALARWWAYMAYDTGVNYVDYMKSVPFTGGGFAATSGVGGQLTFDTTTTLSGKKSLCFNPSSSNDSILAFGPPFRVKEGTSYTMKTTAQTAIYPNGVLQHYFQWLDKDFNNISNAGVTFVTGTAATWYGHALRQTAPAGARYANVALALTLATGKVFVDEVVIENDEQGRTPLGGIIPWHIAISQPSTLPSGYVQCDGQTLADTLSPLNGQLIPDLNNHLGAAQSGYFIRGTNSTTGNTQVDTTAPNGLSAQMATHQHTMVGSTAVFNHVHGLTSTNSGSGNVTAISAPGINTAADATHKMTTPQTTSWSGNTGNSVTNPFCTMLGDAETRPINYGFRYIIRVR